ncbi:hypothetical protein J6590_042921 [Homalodisca vitripennis]|nr:hypothetical protein J6590_042921 [Homalodisca vitripennis]
MEIDVIRGFLIPRLARRYHESDSHAGLLAYAVVRSPTHIPPRHLVSLRPLSVIVTLSSCQKCQDQAGKDFCDELLENNDSTQFLGMYLDKGLTWNNHVDYICARVTSGIYALRNLASYCSQKKKAVIIISQLNIRESCRDAFRELELLTRPANIYWRLPCIGIDVHSYETRGKESSRAQQHRTVAFDACRHRLESNFSIGSLRVLYSRIV